MTRTGMMNAKHARSPVIKIVAGENEVFGDEEADAPLNVFYVSKSLLLENSVYFNIILDSAPGRAVVFLPEHDYLVVADWLDLIFHDRLDFLHEDSLSFDILRKYLTFADLVGSEKLKNVVIDTMQANVAHHSIYALRDLQDNHPSLSVCFDIILECQAYIVVTEGWARFMARTGSDQEQGGWDGFIADKDNLDIVNKLLLKVDDLNKEYAQKSLICPTEREDCKWHDHANEETKAKCPRNDPTKQNSQATSVPDWSVYDGTPTTTDGYAYRDEEATRRPDISCSS
ncbi:hypothetical protein, variant [Phialophora macrospora]|uniref:BTB domain-containing protein n=1 Tax=Phialophora macrospora TaxID=1851006 RepID=A0A0D2FPE2_9EURO|nr:hypothetical protein PV04_02468 [Phialophora macrospora]KIW70174.1 hypothetical protein, variant [Phialophora macrospora]